MSERDNTGTQPRKVLPPCADAAGEEPAIPVMSEEEAGEALRRMNIDPGEARRRIRGLLFREKSAPRLVITKPDIAIQPFSAPPVAGDGVVLDPSGSIYDRLICLPQLVVRSPGSVQSLLGSTTDSLALGRRLGADFVVSGDVVRDGERIVVTARLVNVRDGSCQTFEPCAGSVRQIFAVDNHIAEKVVRRLNLRLTGEELGGLLRSHTENPDAYHKYRLARFHLSKYTRDSLAKAADLFAEAKDLDPSFALAHSGLSDCHIARGIYNMAPPAETFGRALGHAEEALRLDPKLAEAYVSLGYVQLCYGWDWAAAREAFERAIELSPNYALAHQGSAHLWAALGERAAAKAEIDRAVRLDPVSPIVSTVRGFVYYYAGELEESVRSFRQALSVNPKFDAAYYGLSLAQEAQGERADDEAARDELMADAGRAVRIAKWCSSYAYDKAAREAHHNALLKLADKAGKELNSLEGAARREYISPFHLAAVCLELGMRGRALEYLEAGFDVGDQWLVLLGVEPRFKALRGDERFESLVRRLNLHPAGRAERSRKA